MAKRERVQWKNQSVNLVAIALGVYLAFMVSQCQESWSNERLMKRYLVSLRTDLQKDLSSVQADLQTLRGLNRKCSALLRYSQSKKLSDDSLAHHLTGITTQTTFHPSPHAYRSLLANPAVANLIDLELSRQLSELYNGTYESLEVLDALALQNFQTHIVTRFIDGSSFSKTYMKSAAFQGLVQVTADFNRQKTNEYEKAQTQIKTLLQLIDESQP
jgi:hypothetical protein